MKFLAENLKKVKEDFMKTPNSFKTVSVLGIVAMLALPVLYVQGCSYGPSPEFVYKMQERANDHFPKYKKLIDGASNEQLEQIHEELNSGDLKGVDPQSANIQAIKRSMKRAVDSWKHNIDENAELVKGRGQ